MNLGFKDQFVPKVESGEKRHSIRAGRRWRVGMLAHCWKNMRGAKEGLRPQTLLLIAPVIRVEDINIHMHRNVGLRITIEGVMLRPDECEAFARRDGFKDQDAMHKFWIKNHFKSARNTVARPEMGGWQVFVGQVIHWDYDKRELPC